MKRKLLFVAALVVSALGFNVNAQDKPQKPTPVFSDLAEDGETIQYLYNVEAEAFMLGANDWATRASISASKGFQFKVTKSETYKGQLGTGQYVDRWQLEDYDEKSKSWRILGVELNTNNIWVDKKDDENGTYDLEWIITPIPGTQTFTISSDQREEQGYLAVVPSNNNDSRLYLSKEDDAQTTWAAVSESDYNKYVTEYKEYLVALDKYYKSTYTEGNDLLTIGDETAKAGHDKTMIVPTEWKGQSGTYTNDGTGGAEHYQESSMAVGDVLTQTIDGLQNGTYQVTLKLAASYTSGRGFTCPTGDELSVAFAQDKSENLPVKERGNVKKDEYNTFTFDVKVNVGRLQYGIRNIASSGNWYVANVTSIIFKEKQEPTIADGVYYIYNENTGKFMSRGSWWGTRAMADEYGLPFQVSRDNDVYTLQELDNKAYYGDDDWMYGDCTGDRMRSYYINDVEDKEGTYTITNSKNIMNVYVNTHTSKENEKYGIAGNAIKDENYTNDEDTYWKFLTLAEYTKIQKDKAATNAEKLAEKAGVKNLNYAAQGEAKVLSFAEGETGWDNYPTQENERNGNVSKGTYGTEVYQGVQKFTQSVEDLEPGLYLVSVQGFYRGGWNGDVKEAYDKGYDLVLSYLDANGMTVRLSNWAEEAYATSTNDTGFAPNNVEEAKSLFNDADKYVKSVVTYVGKDGKLDLTIMSPSFLNGGWLILNNVTYTKMEPSVTVKEAGWATYVTPVDLTFGDKDAFIITNKTDSYAHLENVKEAPAGTPVIIKADPGTHTFTPKENANDVGTNLLEVSTEDMIGDGTIYILAKGTDDVGFYPLKKGSTLSKGKVYISLSDDNGVKFIGFDFDDNATAIDAVEVSADNENAVIYNLAGQRVANPTKGIYIVNGKKVLVK